MRSDRRSMPYYNGSTAYGTHVGTWATSSTHYVEDTTTDLSLWVLEIGCANGEPATGRIQWPAVDYGPDTIAIEIRIDPPDRADCPGNPETPFNVTLREPVNGRTLLDGSSDPPRVPPETSLRPDLPPTS